MQDYVIQPQEGKKGRSFVGTCVALVKADGLWVEGANNGCIRPIWAMFAGSDSQLRPFMMNLRLGRKADSSSSYRKNNSERLEFLKSVGYYMSWQREEEGTLATIYHPDLFRLDPGMIDPSGAKFVMLVPKDWSEAQSIDPRPITKHMSRFQHEITEEYLQTLVPTAYLFAAYLDRRTRCPLIADGRFYMQLLTAALHVGYASLPTDGIRYGGRYNEWGHNVGHGFRAEGLEAVGIQHALSFAAPHDKLEQFMAEQVGLFFEMTERKPRLSKNALTSQELIRI